MATTRASADSGITTPIDSKYFLQNLNNDYVNSLIPTLIYVSVLMAVGLVGNITVLLVYFKRYKPSTSRTYILAIGVFDLLTNCLSLPGDTLEILYFYTFDMPDLCRGIRFFKSFLTTVSSFILVVVAIDRYHKMCQPSKRARSQTCAYVFIAVCAGASAIISAIYITFTGHHTLLIEDANITGVKCSVADGFVKSNNYRVFTIFTNVLFVSCVIMMTLSYALIARKLWSHRKRAAGVIYGCDASSSGVNAGEEGSHDERETRLERNHDEKNGFNTSFVKLKSSFSKSLVSTDKIRNTFSTTHFKHANKNEDQSSENSLRKYISEEHSMEDCLIASKHNDVNIDAAVTSTKETVVMSPINGSATTNVTNLGEEPELEMLQSEKTLDNSTRKNSCQVNGRAHDTAISSSAQHSVSLLRKTTLTENSERAETELSLKSKSRKGLRKKTGSVKKIPARTTRMMFVMTVIFIFNYLPYLTISFVMVGQDVVGKKFSPLVLNLYQIANRSYFLNCAVNAIVYSFCSARFRQECQRLFCVFSEVRFLCWKK